MHSPIPFRAFNAVVVFTAVVIVGLFGRTLLHTHLSLVLEALVAKRKKLHTCFSTETKTGQCAEGARLSALQHILLPAWYWSKSA